MKRRQKNDSKCPEPLNTLIDILGAVALGAYTRHRVKEDYKSGQGEESIKAAALVYGAGALRSGSQGLINLGGLLGVLKGIDDIKRMQDTHIVPSATTNQPAFDSGEGTNCQFPNEKKRPEKNLWRTYCEDGGLYGVNPEDFSSADDYAQALYDAKSLHDEQINALETKNEEIQGPIASNKYIWRKYCQDGSPFGIKPEDYETADEYEEARTEKEEKSDK